MKNNNEFEKNTWKVIESFFKQNLSEDEQLTVSSIDKLNLLLFRPKEDQIEKYQKELVVISEILDQERYQHLMNFRAFEKQKELFCSREQPKR